MPFTGGDAPSVPQHMFSPPPGSSESGLSMSSQQSPVLSPASTHSSQLPLTSGQPYGPFSPSAPLPRQPPQEHLIRKGPPGSASAALQQMQQGQSAYKLVSTTKCLQSMTTIWSGRQLDS